MNKGVFYVSTECVTSGPLALALRLSRAVGAAPLRVTRAHGTCLVAFSPRLAVVQRLVITASNMVMLAGLVWDFSQEPSKRIANKNVNSAFVVWLSHMLSVQLVANLTIYMGPSRIKRLIRVLKKLHQIKFNLKMKSPSGTSETMRNIAVICMLIWSTGLQIFDAYAIMHAVISANQMWQIVCMYYTYNYHRMVSFVVVLQWSCAVRGARAAAAALNQQLRQLRHDVSLHSSQAEATIRRLALSYTGVSEVVTQLNAGYGAVLYAITMWLFIGLVIVSYKGVKLVYRENIRVPEVFMVVNWCLMYTINLMLVVEPCHGIHKEREKTEHLLSQLTVHLAPKSERLSRELDRFAMQLSVDNAKFMPLGIHTLGRPLVTTILGGVSSYLVIVMQFQ